MELQSNFVEAKWKQTDASHTRMEGGQMDGNFNDEFKLFY